ncbi:rab-GTPase-TBC domain-containing protein [Lipomyces kononenkoae]
MESLESNCRDTLVTVSLSDTSSVASFVPEILSDVAPSTAHSSIGISEELEEKDGDEYETVDWNELERTECEESKDGVNDENIAYLLARLERENARFERDPKALTSSALPRRRRPLSVDKLRKIAEEQNALRISMVPSAPQLTDLEFWAAVVADYPRTAAKLPNLLSKKIKGGVPPPLRGLVWQSMAGASDPTLESLFNAFIAEPSPYDKVIGRDLHRTFPEVEMFRERGGRGQTMLGQVLRAFSLYDMQVGYCQGLAFLVGPLLMHMDERSAFCILVRLMEEYDLRTMFTADMAGLHLRIFQLTQLLQKFVPAVSEHMEHLGVQSIYATQWFLSFFAVTCPLNILLRIYDVIFAEGALETLMRVAVAIMQANQEQILLLREEDEVLQLLLGRSLWQVYEGNADALISDAMSLTTVATRDVLEDLEVLYKSGQASAATGANHADSPTKTSSIQTSELHAAATRFLGRIWSNVGYSSPVHMTPTNSTPARTLRRTGSKASLTSTIISLELDDGSQSLRQSDNKQRELHNQIEDLVTALSELQRQHVSTVEQLEVERRAKEEERSTFQIFLSNLPNDNDDPEVAKCIADMKEKFRHQAESSQRLMTFKDLIKQLELSQADMLMEKERNVFLKRDLDSKCVEVRDLKDQLFEIKGRYQDIQREKTKLERTLNEVRQRQAPPREDLSSEYEYYDPNGSPTTVGSPGARSSPSSQGLRELRLGRQNQLHGMTFNKRSSSLFVPDEVSAVQSAPSSPTPNSLQPPSSPIREYNCDSCDALLMELAMAKTSEAIARQELEEAKNKFDQVRRSMTGGGSDSRAPMIRYATAPSNMQPAQASDGAWPKIGKFGWTR